MVGRSPELSDAGASLAGDRDDRSVGSVPAAGVGRVRLRERHAQHFDGVMRMAFALDGTFDPSPLPCARPSMTAWSRSRCIGSADTEAGRRADRALLSLDHDAAGYPHVGERDPIVGRLMALRPGL